MRILVGLGNPGNKYRLTRHNIGFIFLDHILENAQASFRPGKGAYYYGRHSIAGEEVLLVKPTTYMNHSGLAVREVMGEFGVAVADLLIIYDDFQLPFGAIRFRAGGSAGGHKGMTSVIYHLETEHIPRLRFGIGSEDMTPDAAEFVLSEFSEKELKALPEILKTAYDGVETWIKKGIDQAMSGFNRLVIDLHVD